MKFTHLHVHSDYSLLNGLAKIDTLLNSAEKEGMKTIALTDENAIYGAVDFSVQAKERGIKPIIGSEIRVAPNGMKNETNSPNAKKTNQLVLLVKNKIGYKNLLKIVTAAQLDGLYFGVPRVDYDLLRKYSDGLIALSGNSSGEVNEKVMHDDLKGATEKAKLYQEIFGVGNFYLELQNHPDFKEQEKINKGLIKINKETQIPLVACGDIHYIKKKDKETHDVLLCIKMNRKVDEGDRPNLKHLDLSFRSIKEMEKDFQDIPAALENTEKIAEQCNFEMEIGNTKLPYFPIPEGRTADDLLKEKCDENLKEKFGDKITDTHRKRMDYELDIIEKTGYASYFLIVADFVNWSRDNGIIVGPGRGSAAGSLVSYLTGITNIDPIEYKLLFERFLNPERISMPDVDLDFPDDRRDDVMEYVRKTYGADHVAQIITFGTMAARAAIRDAGRASGYAYDFCDKMAKLIPMFTTIEDTLNSVPDFQRLYKENVDARNLIDAAKKIEGLIRHSSVHACGVIITDKPVFEYTALQKVSGDDEATVTQYASSTKFSAVEKIGLLKMDFLGLKNLTIIQNTLNFIKKIHNVKIDIDKIPLDDKKTYELLQKAQTTGVFQLESSGMKRYLKMLGPTTLEDIIAMVALYRPGPMEWIPDFIEGKHGKKIKYLHPKLEGILADTYGVAVYQEQVMQIVQDLAGFTLGEADILRKAMGKKIFKLIKEQKIKFVEGCVENGISKEIADKVFAFIEPFAGYGFNRSHAACYALIGYQTAYLKAHYPAEFMAALMTADEGNTDRVAIEASECREMKIEVLPPNVNESFENFAVIYGEKDRDKKNPRIRFGLNAIKNVGHNVAKEIVAERKRNGKYKDLSGFCERINSKDLNKRSIEALAMVGGLDELANRDQVLANIESILIFMKELNNSRNTSQDSLFDSSLLSKAIIKLEKKFTSDKKEHLDWEKKLLGLYVSDHPASDYREYLDNACTSLNDLTEKKADKNLTIGGIVVGISKILLKSGKNMAFVTIEDGKSSIECLVFPNLLKDTEDLWQDGVALKIKGKLSAKDGELKFLADSAEIITPEEITHAKRMVATKNKYSTTKNNDKQSKTAPENNSKINKAIQNKNDKLTSKNIERKLIIKLPENGTKEIIDKLKVIFDDCEIGDTKIFLEHQGSKMKTSYSIEINSNCKNNLIELIGENGLIFEK
ncbi:MAG: DNA polymerase III subunit alpha [Candidatus Moranbacteria bacterium]|nr:DNA polymerase III subunit alpha [Candidatus Moranbacteria bacterium]